MTPTSNKSTSRTPRVGFIFCLVIAIALFVVSLVAYPHMVPELTTRPAGNGHGENSPSREFTAFVLPAILAAVAGAVAMAPRLNPRFLERFPKGAVANVENSRRALNWALILVGILFAALHLGLVAQYMNLNISFEAIMATVTGLVVAGLGAILPWTRPGGHFHNATLERIRTGSSRAYRPAGYILMASGALTMALAWIHTIAAMIVGVCSVVVAFGLILLHGLRSAVS